MESRLSSGLFIFVEDESVRSYCSGDEEEVSDEEEVFVDCVVVEVADDVGDDSEDEHEDSC